MSNPSPFTSQVRRVDLILRARFPNLTTRIFEITPDRFRIVFLRELQRAEELTETFKTIRYASLHVDLGNDFPTAFLREIPAIADDAPVDGFSGLPLRRFDIFNLAAGRFPKLPIVDIRESSDRSSGRELLAVVDEPLAAADMVALLDFLNKLALPLPWRVEVESGAHVPPVYPGDDPLFVLAARLRAAPSFVQRDEAFWFAHVEAAAAGDLGAEAFPAITPGATRCYLDCTLGRQINLRQALMLYDEVYCACPLATDHPDFLAAQALTEADLLALVEAGRLKFVITQPEERLNLRFHEAVDERSKNAILGRRATAALLLDDVARTAEDYWFNQPSLQPVLTQLCELVAAALKMEKEVLLKALLWPVASRRGAILGLIDGASKRGPALEIGSVLAARLKAAKGVDVALETMVLSERVHIGHALDATVFPGVEEPDHYGMLMRAMGDELNMYRNFNTRIAAVWAANRERRASGVVLMPPIALFDFDASIPVAELLEETRLASTRRAGRALFARMADLTVDERRDDVARLQAHLRRRGRRTGKLVSFDNADTGVAVASLFLEFLYPPLAGLKNLAAQVTDKLRRLPLFDTFIDALQRDTFGRAGSNRDLDFLSRIDRVASFKVDRVA